MKRKLQVFVSSTYSDLIEERQAAVGAILKAGHIPAGMELFTAGDKSQMKTIERWIDESDVFMLILAGRYGSIEPSTGLSYTELEYDYAASRSIPFFAIVIEQQALDKRIKDRGTSVLELDNSRALEQFRKKVLSSISSFFSDEKDVRLCVHESLSDLATNVNLKGWVSASEIPDTTLLSEEIARLKEENGRLREQLQKMDRIKVDSGSSTNQTLSDKEIELVNLLHSIEVNVPKAVSGANEDKKISLLLLAYSNRDLLVNGIYNRPEMSGADKFMYFNVFPKLHLHGLAANEAVPGTGYRRMSLSEAGRKLVATLEYGFWKSGGGPAKPTEETKSPEPKLDTAAQTTNLPSVENAARVKS